MVCLLCLDSCCYILTHWILGVSSFSPPCVLLWERKYVLISKEWYEKPWKVPACQFPLIRHPRVCTSRWRKPDCVHLANLSHGFFPGSLSLVLEKIPALEQPKRKPKGWAAKLGLMWERKAFHESIALPFSPVLTHFSTQLLQIWDQRDLTRFSLFWLLTQPVLDYFHYIPEPQIFLVQISNSEKEEAHMAFDKDYLDGEN